MLCMVSKVLEAGKLQDESSTQSDGNSRAASEMLLAAAALLLDVIDWSAAACKRCSSLMQSSC